MCLSHPMGTSKKSCAATMASALALAGCIRAVMGRSPKVPLPWCVPAMLQILQVFMNVWLKLVVQILAEESVL